MIITKTNKQTNKQAKKNKQTKNLKNKQQKQAMQQPNLYVYSSNSRQRKKFDEVLLLCLQKP